MDKQPNILFLMTDQMQGQVLRLDHVCQTPNFDKLAQRGVRFDRAYTPNAVCSPARASLMTGLLPHNHGVLEVTHVVDDDQCVLRTEHPHWAQRLETDGYKTMYFGKWHVERSNDLTQFGWQVNGVTGGDLFKGLRDEVLVGAKEASFSVRKDNELPEGYQKSILYGVTDQPIEERGVGLTTELAYRHLQDAVQEDDPWCCFVSVLEPHDPFICGEEAYSKYDVDAIELCPNVFDDLSSKPNIYRKAGLAWADFTDRHKKEAAACYYASVTEIDEQYGRLIDLVEKAGQLDNTIIVLTSDHGELLGSHGLYCKNYSGFEEVYHIPMVVAGPGITDDKVSDARVGLHDLCPTLLDLVGSNEIDVVDSASFAPVLRNPESESANFQKGFAEYHGGRYRVTQRVVYDGAWKLVMNGFDFDELYNLDDDPYEMTNLIDVAEHRPRLRELTKYMWQVIRDTGDRSLWNSQYPVLRVAPFGPEILTD
ncbi:MAG: sulfatase-like hydrolase/transferase [Candidatus Latescibacteria bacterium]|jgi:arylsulfatase A-like enzyme|nr:sulfatase-like hydrolase/transferase [Candidatus Latescibacterota bacterium]